MFLPNTQRYQFFRKVMIFGLIALISWVNIAVPLSQVHAQAGKKVTTNRQESNDPNQPAIAGKSNLALPSPASNENQSLTKPDPQTEKQLNEFYGRLPLSFELNQGQTDKQVKFISRSSSYDLYLTSTEAVLVLPKKEESETLSTDKDIEIGR